MSIATGKFSAILWGFAQVMKVAARRHPKFRERLCERNLIAQIKARDEEVGRWFEVRGGKVRSGAGLHAEPDITLAFKNAAIGASLLTPPINWLDQINAQKDFNLTVDGPEDLTNWWAQTMMATHDCRLEVRRTRLADGTMRYCNMTNGGPVFVYVKDGRIVRMTPIDFDDTDPQPWTIRARGMNFTPPRKTTLAPHGQNAKSIVYSPDRLLHPMKRVDFDPNGARNPENRGKSGYVRISWDEALDIVSSEIKRLKSTYGPGRDGGVPRLAPHLGQYRLLPLGAASFPQRRRLHPGPPQSRQLGRLVLGRGASLGPYAARRPVRDLRHRRGLPAELRHDRVLGGGPGDHQRLLRRPGRHGAPAVAQEPQARHQDRPRRSLFQRLGAIPAGQMVRAQADHLGRDGDGDRLCLDQGRPLRQGLRAHPHGRFRRVEGLSPRRGGRHRRRRRNGSSRRPAFRPRTSARSPANGARSASISRPAAGATAMAAPAATRPASNGPASWCASWPCRASASPASTWAICNGAARSISISISRAMPTAACPAISKTPRCRSSSISACRSCRPWPRPTSAFRASGCRRRSPRARPRAMPGPASRSSTSSRSSPIRRRAMRR